MTDVLIVGGGPAGSIAALVLARAGVERHDSRSGFVSARQALRRLGKSWRDGAAGEARSGGGVDQRGLPMSGMLVTGPGGVAVHARYPGGVVGRSIADATSMRCCSTRPLAPARVSNRASVSWDPSSSAPPVRRASPACRRRRVRDRPAGLLVSSLPQTAGGRPWPWRWDSHATPVGHAAGPLAPISKASRAFWTSARCTCAADTTSASRRSPAGWPTRAWSCPRHAREPSGLPRPRRWSSALQR